MAKTETNFRDELTKLAEISEIFDNSIFNKGNVSVVIELKPEDYRNIINTFSPRDVSGEQLIINISGIEFTLVLSK